MIGLIPPQAIDLEKAVLSAFLIDSSVIADSLIDIHTEVFYCPKNKLIFDAIKTLFLESNQVDLLLVSNKLKETNKLKQAGGTVALIKLTQVVGSSAHTSKHCKILLQLYLKRKLIQLGSELIAQAHEEDTDALELLEKSYSSLNQIAETTVKSEEKKVGDVTPEVIKKGINLFNKTISPGILTPIESINKSTGGWPDSEFIIIAARPGMGKTAFALECAKLSAKNGIPSAFFSLEMSKSQLTSRLMSMEYKIASNKFSKDGLSGEDTARINGDLDKIPLYIDDTAGLSIERLQIKASQMKFKYGIKILFVDYLQLMCSTSNKGNREQEISKISRGLKLISKELDIPVIALSQLSRAVETRGGDKRPQLSDLRESGSLEQDADKVSFLYRPEYYGINEWGEEYQNESSEGEAEFYYAKNRSGSLMRTRMKFEGQFTLFSDLIKKFNYGEVKELKESVSLPTASTSEAFDNDDDIPFL